MSKIRVQQKSNNFGKILLAILFVVVVVGACISLITMPSSKLNNNLNASDSEQTTDDNNQTESGSSSEELNTENIDFDVKKGGTFVYHVGLVDFADIESVFDTEKAIEKYNRLFNEIDFSNDFTSVYEYFYLQSEGKLRVVANISHLNLDESYYPIASASMNYALEKAIFDLVVENGDVKVFNGQYNAGIVVLPGAAMQNSVSWAHTWLNKGLMVLSESQAENTVICHESGHVFGLYDLYTATSFDAVYTYELMGATDTSILSPINAYHRSSLNWILESDFDDDYSTDIEVISKSGTYTLNPATSLNGVIAYKFAENSAKTESFYAEFRMATGNGVCNALPYGQSYGLYIYRVNNKVKNGNLYALGQQNCEVYAFMPLNRTNQNSRMFTNEDTIGLDSFSTLLHYSDGTKADVAIKNIVVSNGLLSFDVNFASSKNTIYTGMITYGDYGQSVSDVEVYVNDVYATKTNTNGVFSVEAKEGDVLTFKCAGYEIEPVVLGNIASLTIKAVKTICYIQVSSGYTNFVVDFYVDNEKVLSASSGPVKSLRIWGHVKLDGSEKYKLVYTRGTYKQTYEILFERNGQTVELNIDPFIDEETVTRLYTGTLTLNKNGALSGVEVYVDDVYATTTDANGAFKISGKKGQVVSFRYNDIEIASKTLSTSTSLNVVSDYFVAKITIKSGCSGYIVSLMDENNVIGTKTNCSKETVIYVQAKYNETKNYKILYVSGNVSKEVSIEISVNKQFAEVLIDDNEKTTTNDKSILDKIGDGVDFFIYNMSEGFKELGRRLKFW